MSDIQNDLRQFVEGNDGISVVRRAGLSAKNVNAKKLSMNGATIPPGGRAARGVQS